MKDELATVRKAVNDLPAGPLKGALQEVISRYGGITTQDSGGGGPTNPPEPPK